MNGALLDQMRTDAGNIVEQGGFETEITITNLSGLSAIVKGLASLHSIMFNLETGLPVNGRNAHVTLNLSSLSAFDIYSNSKKPNSISMSGWGVSFKFTDGKVWKFKATDVKPSYTFDVVVIQLTDGQ
jgi:hypothetical protein